MNSSVRRLFLTLGIAVVLGLALPAAPGARASTGETGGLPTEVVAKLTGPNSLNRTDLKWNVYGTDLGHMFLHGDELRFTFGDTFGSAMTDHRDNTMAWSSDKTLANGLKFDNYVIDRPRHAKKLFDDETVSSVIPTYGISVGGRMFLHYMAVRRWGDPGYWDVAYSGLAYSDDRGQTWTMDPDVKWGDDSNFAQVAMLDGSSGPLPPGDVPYVYLFGIPEGRFGGALHADDAAELTGVQLARVPEGSLLEPGAYRYWDGSRWVEGEQNAKTVVPWPVGELSVRWSGYYKKWLMTYLNDNNLPGEPERIVLRSADDFKGPWSGELLLTTSAEYPNPYAPYQVPNQPDSPHLYYNMSRFWPEYNVFLMRTTLPDPLPSSDTAHPSSDRPTLIGLVDRTLRRLLR